VLSRAEELPLPVAGEQEYPEEIRLRYRFLDLRRETLHANIVKRTQIIRKPAADGRRYRLHRIFDADPDRLQPEGARDFLVPSRIHRGQVLRAAAGAAAVQAAADGRGLRPLFPDRPCFRDEDPRADRLPGEFYQLDLEMSFVTQEEVWDTMEPVMAGVFETFADGKVTPAGSSRAFPMPGDARLWHRQAGPAQPADHPRCDRAFRRTSGFGLFEKIVGSGGVSADPGARHGEKSRKFFDDMNDWARSEGHAGLGYVTRKGGEFGGPIAKNHGEEDGRAVDALGLGPDDGAFFAAGKEEQAAKLAGPRAPAWANSST
jgi:aspartyl-tRNA synthetase